LVNLWSETQRGALGLYHGDQTLLTYGSMVLWPRVRYNVGKLRALACLPITGATKTTPSRALEVLLGLPTLYVMIEAEA
jgi:hypothetical protein